MDNSETHGSNRNALRQPFIDTANALASLYKQSVAAERDARDAGSRMAYQRIIQWAAKKSRSGEPLSAADVVSFCATELAQLPNNPPSSDRTTNSPPQSSPPISTSQARNQDSEMPNCNAPPVAYVARDDALVSDIKKLHVNPRKRQRVDISDAFIRACSGEENAFVFSPDHLYALQNHDNSSNALSAQNALHASQQNTHQSKKDAKDGRDMFVHHTSGNDYNSRKPRNPKMHMYDKHKRK